MVDYYPKATPYQGYMRHSITIVDYHLDLRLCRNYVLSLLKNMQTNKQTTTYGKLTCLQLFAIKLGYSNAKANSGFSTADSDFLDFQRWKEGQLTLAQTQFCNKWSLPAIRVVCFAPVFSLVNWFDKFKSQDRESLVSSGVCPWYRNPILEPCYYRDWETWCLTSHAGFTTRRY